MGEMLETLFTREPPPLAKSESRSAHNVTGNHFESTAEGSQTYDIKVPQKCLPTCSF